MLQSSATPLIALEAVVLDTETTGLDPANAHIVEIGAVPLTGGRLDEAGTARRLVHAPIPVPLSATAIHGIDDAALASAPPFAAVWPELRAFVGDRALIGHAIGFDLAVLRSECARAQLPWAPPRALCTRLLAQVARPNLAGYSLDELAAWLNVAVGARHSATGDALTAGRIFLALVPLLRERGVRTLAEAEAACRGLTDVLAEQHRAGWAEAITAPAAADRALPRIDTHPFRHTVGDLMSRPQVAPETTTVDEAIRRLAHDRISSLFLSAASEDAQTLRPDAIAIVTERDLLRALAQHGAAALDMPAAAFASSPVLAVAQDALLYRAIARMRGLKVRHLGVFDEEGRLCGAVSARDLLRQRGEEAIWLGDEIDEAADVPQLARAWTRVPLIAETLLAEDVSGIDAAAVISRELCALTRRAAVLAEQHMRAAGHGEAPCPYAVAVLGSAGRGESLLAMDQDNALVFAEGEPEGENDRWFAAFGAHMATILHEAGVPYCKGGVMAKNAEWRGSAATWRDRVDRWITRSNPQDLLSVDIFFDLLGVHGELALASGLRRHAFDRAQGEIGFAKLLAEAAGTAEPAFGWFGRLRTEQGRIDLKKAGLFAIVTAARVLAIRHHVTERSTPARLAALQARGIGAAADIEPMREAHGVLMTLILRQQIDDLSHGVPPTNAIAIKRLSERERAALKSALTAVQHADEMTRDLLFQSR